jgi:hypothetical protein
MHVSPDHTVALRFTPLRTDTEAWVNELLAEVRGSDA